MIDIKELLKAGVHFGHQTSKWCPSMAPFIWGAKNKIHLIDIAKTAFLLNRATSYLEEVSAEGKDILWIGTKKSARNIIERTAKSLNMPFVIHRWIGGTLSNYSEIKKAMTRLLHLRDVLDRASARSLGKKEISSLQKEVARLERNIGGILNLKYPPAAVVIVDAKKEHAAVKESLGLKIPIICMVDTNTNPTNINFVIPANDDAPRSIECIINHLSNAVANGKAKYEEEHKEEIKAKEEARKAKEDARNAARKKEDERRRKAKEDELAIFKKTTPKEIKKPHVAVKPREIKPKKVEAKPAPKAKTEEKAATKKIEEPKETTVSKELTKEKVAPKKVEKPKVEKKETKKTTTKKTTTSTTKKKTTTKKAAPKKSSVIKKAAPSKKTTTKKKSTTTKKATTKKKITSKKKVVAKKKVTKKS